MTTFNWTISATERAIALGELSDVIQVVHWRYKGTNENGVTAETYGATAIGEPNPQDFTPYNELTEGDVAVWLVDILGAEPEVQEGNEVLKSNLVQMQESIEAQIDAIVNPKTIIAPLYTEAIVEPIVEEPVVE